mgnify:CR=1 FL=1
MIKRKSFSTLTGKGDPPKKVDFDKSTPVIDPFSGKSYDVYKNKEGEVTYVGATGAMNNNTRAEGHKFYYKGDAAKKLAGGLARNADEQKRIDQIRAVRESNPDIDYSQDEAMNQTRVDHVKYLDINAEK